MMKRHTVGFTLIELLTVIAIIGILAAILIPVVGRVREQARLTQCSSNLRQWGMANLLFAADNNGLIPWEGGTNHSPGNLEVHRGTVPWWNALPHYLSLPTIREMAQANALPRLGENSIFVCPSAQRTNNAPAWLSYGPNFLLSSREGRPDRPTITTIEMIREDHRVVLFGPTTNLAPGSTAFIAQTSAPQHLGAAAQDVTRHGGRAPIVFFDNHVAIFTREELRAQLPDQSQGQPEMARVTHRVLWNPLHQ